MAFESLFLRNNCNQSHPSLFSKQECGRRRFFYCLVYLIGKTLPQRIRNNFKIEIWNHTFKSVVGLWFWDILFKQIHPSRIPTRNVVHAVFTSFSVKATYLEEHDSIWQWKLRVRNLTRKPNYPSLYFKRRRAARSWNKLLLFCVLMAGQSFARRNTVIVLKTIHRWCVQILFHC